jgi:hypothetical protein
MFSCGINDVEFEVVETRYCPEGWKKGAQDMAPSFVICC